jgi:hypothetical protein
VASPSTPPSGSPRAAFCRAALTALGAWLALAHGPAAEPGRVASFLALAAAVFVFLPVVMATAICALIAVPIAVLGPIAAAARLWSRRATGFRELIAGFVGQGLAVVPGYLSALRRVHSPQLWGAVAGSLLALPVLAWSARALR